MKVYFLRHGEADWPGWTLPDDERPLTKKGKKELKRVADFLADHDAVPDVLLTSPLARAYQTAEIIAERLDRSIQEEPTLGLAFDPKKLAALLAKNKGKDVMLVGHEPGFSGAIAALTGADVRLAKAGIARVDINETDRLRGQLIWLVTPKIVK